MPLLLPGKEATADGIAFYNIPGWMDGWLLPSSKVRPLLMHACIAFGATFVLL